jgi:predicted type IV restriction endonuclease
MARYGVQLHRATIQHISKLMIQDPYNEDYIRAMVILKILEVIGFFCPQR